MKRLTHGLVALLCLASAGSSAQQLEPIYVQYNGWIKNKDGQYLISFGYYNTNHISVTMPIGENNQFIAAPPDRGQVTTFEPGRKRFACAMVVEPDFDGKLQWSVTVGGKSSTTTDKMLDPNYEIEPGLVSAATAGLNITNTTPRGQCLNRPPYVRMLTRVTNPAKTNRSGTEFKISAGQELSLDSEFFDDGLPRLGKVTTEWRKISGPGDVSFETRVGSSYENYTDNTTLATRARFSAPGAYALELAVSDGEKVTKIAVKVSVTQ